MPLSGAAGQRSGGNQFTPIVTNNNAFSVKIVPLDGAMEEKPNQKVDAQAETRVKVGDMVSGEVVKSGEKKIGKVVAIQQEDGEIVGYKILDDEGKEIILDPSTTNKFNKNDGSENPAEKSVVGESLSLKSSTFIPSFDDWRNSLDTGY